MKFKRLAFLLLAFGQSTQVIAADDGAQRGAAALQWIEGFECPTPGERLSVAGLETIADARAHKVENQNYVETRQESLALALRARRQIEREVAKSGKRPSKRVRKSFAELDAKIDSLGGNVAYALSQWVLAAYVEISMLDVEESPSSSQIHPLQQFSNQTSLLQKLAEPYGSAVIAVPQRWQTCLNMINNKLAERFEVEILSDAETAGNPQGIQDIYNRITVRGLRNDSPIIVQVRSMQLALAEQQRREIERQRAERDAEARKILLAQAERERKTALQYVKFIRSGRINSAVSLLTSDVFLKSRSGNARGRQAVAQRMRDAEKSEKTARLSDPIIGSDLSIYSRITSGGRKGRMLFGFRDSKIATIQLVQ